MRQLLLIACLASLQACSYLSPHKIEIQQGNFISSESFAKVKTGMTKAEVRSALGTPLLQDVFHDSRWDYYFGHDRYGGFAKMARVSEQRRITLHFEKDRLIKIEGDVSLLPSDKPVEKKS